MVISFSLFGREIFSIQVLKGLVLDTDTEIDLDDAEEPDVPYGFSPPPTD